ncbi:Na+/H+ antiporter NhaA [Pseudonocardia sp.]|uniref:Na+/H+ antiporter NhaA n=1 Tax=Pseudonocardia sp. TaxID=60912 RepID=UPI003D0C2ACC
MTTTAPERTDAGPAGPLSAQVAAPVRRFLRTEAGSAGLLLAATIAALLWANLGSGYEAFWDTELAIRLGDHELSLSLQHWVNDGLMVFFFFVVGLEVKRELVMGELTDRRRAAVPLAAAITGLVVPALVYLAVNPSGPAAHAWGVVISTDTAFLLGVLVLVGPACPTQLRLFLLTLAVADDVGALGVIAIFYTEELAIGPLVLAAAGLALMAAMRFWLRLWRGPAYLVVGVGVWLAMHESGVHPTIAGVVIALLSPAYPPQRDEVEEAERLTRAYRQSPSPEYARAARLGIERTVSANERLQLLFRPWSSYVIVPIFALANAGVVLDSATIAASATSPVTLGIVAGLVLGKLVGILGGAAAAVGLRLGVLAPGLRFGQLAGGAALSGIGFTISLFIVDLALDDDPALADQARVGVLAASLLAALLGWALFRIADLLRGGELERRPTALDPPVDPERDHVRGPVDAPLTLVEFGDFECPFCGRATGLVEELRERFGDRLRYVFRHVPLVDPHPHAELAAEAAEAAGAQGRFWEMHDVLFRDQGRLRAVDLLEHAEEIGLDVERFARDLGSGRFAARVREDAASADASGVAGTPTFFVNGVRHTGPTDTASLAAALGDPGPAPVTATTAPARPLPALGNPGRAEIGDRVDPALLPPDPPETPDDGGAYPRLSAEQIALLERHGTRRTVVAGDVLFREGDPGYDLFVVLSGRIGILEHAGTPEQRVVKVNGAGRFLGELNLLGHEPVFLSAVAVTPGEVLDVPVTALRTAFAESPALRDLVVRAFLLRRSRLLRFAAELRIIGHAGDPATTSLRTLAQERGVAVSVVDPEEDGDGAAELLDEMGIDLGAEGEAGRLVLPIALWRDEVLLRPTPDELAALLDERPATRPEP